MSALYLEFSDTLKNEVSPLTSPKAPKAPRIDAAGGSSTPTLGTLGVLGGLPAQSPNSVVEAEANRPVTPVEAWRASIARLNPAHNLCHPTLESWQMLIRDCQRFVDSEWAGKAVALGWNERALFGANPVRPDVLSWWGTLHHLHGGEITAISAGLMTIKTRRGVRQTLRRHDHPASVQVPVWMLLK